jgi:hypothetical protein
MLLTNGIGNEKLTFMGNLLLIKTLPTSKTRNYVKGKLNIEGVFNIRQN